MKSRISLLLMLLAFQFSSIAQKNAYPEKANVFFECTYSWLCDFDYVRTEIKMVNFVRDRFESDVHVQINAQFSSAGGESNQVIFLGQKSFQGLNDTLSYFNNPTATEDDKRKQLVQYLKIGLTRYVAKTANAKFLQITSNGTDSTSTNNSNAAVKKDPWNYWVFQFGASGSYNGTLNNTSHSFYGYVNADRETEKWKTNFSVSADKSVSIYKDSSGDSRFERKNYDGRFTVARAINQHWSYGLSSAYQNSLYKNIRNGFIVRPRLEYSFFPYSAFNNQRIVIQYLVGPLFNSYYDTTVYFKSHDFQVQQSVNLITSINKPWGNINVGVFWSNYFDDLSKNNLSFNGAVNWKITKGLNFGLYGYYSLIHDQITLRKGQATRDQLLINNRELFSTYEFNLGMGFSYRFGSINNSIVNPRFKGLSYSVNF